MQRHTNILLESGTNELEIIEFTLTYENSRGEAFEQPFGINVAKVREIIHMPAITALPEMPESICGMFKLRNELMAAMDLRQRLYGVPTKRDGVKIIVAEFNRLRIGFIVNKAHRIHRLSWTQVESPEALDAFGLEGTTVTGLVKLGEKIILMLDLEKIVADIQPQLSLADDYGAGTPDFQNLTVLLAEDSATIRNMLTHRLEGAGFSIISCNNGEEAWQRLQTIATETQMPEKLHERIHLVITDIEMPRMDGYTLTRKIKEHGLLSRIPVIIFSSIISESQFNKGLAVGADAQLSKPKVGELLTVVENLLSGQEDAPFAQETTAVH